MPKENEPNLEIKKVDEKKSKKLKYILYLVVIFGLTSLFLGLSLSGTTEYNGETLPTTVAIGRIFSDLNISYILLFIGFLILAPLLGAFALFLYARLYTRRYKYHQAVGNQLVGTFYNSITPGNSYTGGQFAQAVTFKKQGVHISNAASILVMQYIVFQTCQLILGLISLFKIENVLNIGIITIGDSFEIPIFIFIILGFLLNAIIIIAMYSMSFSRRFHYFMLNHGVNLLANMHIVVDPDKKRQELRIQIENFRIELRRLSSNIPFTILIYLVTFLILIVNDSFPYLIGLGLNGFNDNTIDIFARLFDSVVYTNYHQMICGLIPIPGNAGVSEFIFTSLFGNYYSAEFISNSGVKAAMLMWRFFTYYLPFLFSAVVAGTYKAKSQDPQEERFYSLDRNTFVTLQLETYEERKETSDLMYQTTSIRRKDIINRLRKKKTNNNAKIKEEEVKKDENSDIY